MSTRIDLDDLEQNALAVVTSHTAFELNQWGCDVLDGRRWRDEQISVRAQHIASNSPPVTLALTARIRELDDALSDALAIAKPGDERDRLVAVLAKGAVRP